MVRGLSTAALGKLIELYSMGCFEASATEEKTADKAVERTRGGLNTKMNAAVDGLGNPVGFMLSAGNGHDSVHAVELLKKVKISGSNFFKSAC